MHLAGTQSATSPVAGAGAAIGGSRPRVAVLREQGVNSHVELSYAMDRAGFERIRYTVLAGGIIAIHSGVKASEPG